MVSQKFLQHKNHLRVLVIWKWNRSCDFQTFWSPVTSRGCDTSSCAPSYLEADLFADNLRNTKPFVSKGASQWVCYQCSRGTCREETLQCFCGLKRNHSSWCYFRNLPSDITASPGVRRFHMDVRPIQSSFIINNSFYGPRKILHLKEPTFFSSGHFSTTAYSNQCSWGHFVFLVWGCQIYFQPCQVQPLFFPSVLRGHLV